MALIWVETELNRIDERKQICTHLPRNNKTVPETQRMKAITSTRVFAAISVSSALLATSVHAQERRVLAATDQGLVDAALPAGGSAIQPSSGPNAGAIVTSAVGDRGTAHSETDGAAIAGASGNAFVTRYGVAFAGVGGQAGGGAGVTAIVKDGGSATTGAGGISIVKHNGEAKVDAQGIAIAFEEGVVSATANGSLIIIGYRDAAGRIQFKVGEIGKEGLHMGVRYMLDAHHRFVPAP
jgi:hypothetical protein